MGEVRHDIDGYEDIVNHSIDAVAHRLEVMAKRLRQQRISATSKFSGATQALDFVREFYSGMNATSALLTNVLHNAEVLDRCVATNIRLDAEMDKQELPRWTGHGHWIGDGPEPLNDPQGPRSRARCGGVHMCGECKNDLASRRRALGMEPTS